MQFTFHKCVTTDYFSIEIFKQLLHKDPLKLGKSNLSTDFHSLLLSFTSQRVGLYITEMELGQSGVDEYNRKIYFSLALSLTSEPNTRSASTAISISVLSLNAKEFPLLLFTLRHFICMFI